MHALEGERHLAFEVRVCTVSLGSGCNLGIGIGVPTSMLCPPHSALA
jgi:hypothetical protein